eukprot:Gb_27915 [translate_table: standard]
MHPMVISLSNALAKACCLSKQMPPSFKVRFPASSLSDEGSQNSWRPFCHRIVRISIDFSGVAALLPSGLCNKQYTVPVPRIGILAHFSRLIIGTVRLMHKNVLEKMDLRSMPMTYMSQLENLFRFTFFLRFETRKAFESLSILADFNLASPQQSGSEVAKRISTHRGRRRHSWTLSKSFQTGALVPNCSKLTGSNKTTGVNLYKVLITVTLLQFQATFPNFSSV